MKLLDPIPETSIPEKSALKHRNPFYDQIATTVSTLGNLMLPVECESRQEVNNLLLGMKNRKLKVFIRGLTVYVGNKEEGKT